MVFPGHSYFLFDILIMDTNSMDIYAIVLLFPWLNPLPYCVVYFGLDARNRSSGVSEKHRRRPACASAQSDQRLVIRFL